jgi:hypothetical protein
MLDLQRLLDKMYAWGNLELSAEAQNLNILDIWKFETNV